MKRIVYIFIFIALISVPFLLHGAVLKHYNYPKLANLFYRWHIEDKEVAELAKWDILIIDMDVQTYSPQYLKKLKELNPNIILLAYLAPEEVRGDSGSLTGTLRQKFYNKIEPNWWLKNDTGGSVAWWGPNPMINITPDAPTVGGKRWSDVLPEFVNNELMLSGYWDGVFYDNCWDDVGFLTSLKPDTNNDGVAENYIDLTSKWRAGMIQILDNTRKILGPDKIIMGNGGEYYYKYVNGTLYESFPAKGWAQTLDKYRFISSNGVQPPIGVLNTNVNNTGKRDNYSLMRFGLASALMGNGYNSFDNGDMSHSETWWYDEYEASLGVPVGEATNILNNNGTKFQNGVWRRNYENGLVLVNSTDKAYTVDLGGEYEKLHGLQDPRVNDGSFITSVNIPAQDGLVLLRSVEKIYDATYVNGSFARVFNRFGHVARTGFFAYLDAAQGGNQVVERDIDNDGIREIIVADNSKVKIIDEGVVIKTFYPYSENYNKGINISVGDLDNNGTFEIITGTENGGGPQVRIFNSKGDLINPGFFAYAKTFRGGVNITVCDLEGDGAKEIIAGAGVTGGPHVRIFAADGRLINPGFFAYDPKFRGGVNVACGDIDGDGQDEIITGQGRGGAPEVKVFNKNGKIDGPQFFAFDSKLRNGVEVAVSDMDQDGIAEIIATSADVFSIMGLE